MNNCANQNRIKFIAFHLPQFHTFPENDEWWGKGFTEWVNVKGAKKMFEDHNQPREPLNDNYYNMLSLDTLREQAELSVKYGIDGFCYYHYWFNGKKLMEKPVELLLSVKEINQQYCFCWANEPWTRSWDGKNGCVLIDQNYGEEKEWEEHFQYLLPFFSDDRYIKVDNKPVFVIYRANSIRNYEQMICYLKERAKGSGFDGLYIIEEKNYYQNKKESKVSDAIIHFEPMNTLQNGRSLFEKIEQRLESEFFNLKNHNSIRYYNYDKVWYRLLKEYKKCDKNTIPGAFVDWDNTPRRKDNGMVFLKGNPKKFGKFLEHLVFEAEKKNSEFVFINAWNEWAEGTYLEPDKKYGFEYLEEIKRIKAEF